MSTVKRKSAPKGAPSSIPSAVPITVDARLDRLRELVKILEASALAELSYEDEDISVSLAKQASGHAAVTAPQMNGLTGAQYAPYPALASVPPAPMSSAGGAEPPAATDDPSLVLIRSPFVGTFYRAPRPGTPAFTEIGERVRRGQTICIVEAMKLMNEIESEVDGVVAEILVENAKPVQYGDPLFKIKKG
ncbi:MAG: acetyl-CoA carboxylase biotin carboxyl carrier protein [Deltaproteobacteria bacterium]|nr:acetyl-CoA carboxylase biotin carboxyl carrier protein [Deltaproteobacteria bacterium]